MKPKIYIQIEVGCCAAVYWAAGDEPPDRDNYTEETPEVTVLDYDCDERDENRAAVDRLDKDATVQQIYP